MHRTKVGTDLEVTPWNGGAGRRLGVAAARRPPSDLSQRAGGLGMRRARKLIMTTLAAGFGCLAVSGPALAADHFRDQKT